MGKSYFITALGQFLADNLSDLEIEKIIYKQEETGDFAYICYLNKNQKRIDITASSNISIMKDILNNIETTEYLLPSQRIAI